MAKKSKLKKSLKPIKVLEFKVTLLSTNPPVWRSFLAHEIIELPELHMLIQKTMGWDATHLYEFKINNISYMDKESEEEQLGTSAEGVLFRDVIGTTKKFSYIYDFGDDWEHEVQIVRTLDHDTRMKYPICIGGENACPPEDCGGPHGFEMLKEALKGKDSEDNDELVEWVGGFYNPTTFDPNFINKHLLWVEI